MTGSVVKFSEMVRSTEKLDYVFRLVQYVATFLMGHLLGQAQKHDPPQSEKPNKKKKKGSQEVKGYNNDKPDHQEFQQFYKVKKLKEQTSYSRKIFRWGIILHSFFVFKGTLEKATDHHQLPLYFFCSLLQALSVLTYLMFDQATLYYYFSQNQSKKIMASKLAVKYGNIPAHFFNTLKFAILSLYTYSSSGMSLAIEPLFRTVQNVLDLLMYTTTHKYPNRYKTIGALGVLTSLMVIYNNMQ